jgi:hypothetical protein
MRRNENVRAKAFSRANLIAPTEYVSGWFMEKKETKDENSRNNVPFK